MERMVPVARLDVTIDFLAGVTVNSFESGGIILIDRATLSLLLLNNHKKIRKI